MQLKHVLMYLIQIEWNWLNRSPTAVGSVGLASA